MLEIGSIVDGKYKILNKIGQGGMSVVYLAMNERANKQWAIKEIRKDGTQDFEVVKQGLVVETDMLKRLHHPNLPSIIDVIEDEGSFLIVMDYIEGNPLSKYLDSYGAQNQDDVIEWSKQLCDVLGYLHSRQPPIIYRDMKPANVMIKPDGKAMLIDFGTAREFKSGNIADTTCLGTRGYAAPEQYGGHGQTDARTDIYCLGATMYHLITGQNPANPPYEMRPIREWNPLFSSGLEEIIIKCTKHNPEERYQNCAELMYALENYQELDVDRKRIRTIKWRSFLTASIAAVVFAVAACGFKIGESSMTKNTYENYIDQAAISSSYSETQREDFLKKAIELDPTRGEAYESLLELYYGGESGAELIPEENKKLTEIINGKKTANGETYINVLAKESPEDYAEFAYNLGSAYYFGFEDPQSGESTKVSYSTYWFAQAVRTNTLQGQELSDANLMKDLSENYYKMLNGSVRNDGTSDLNYSTFWKNMTDLAASANSTNDLKAIKIGKFVAATIGGNYADFQKNGISLDSQVDLLDTVNGIYDKVNQGENNTFYASDLEMLNKVIVQANDKIGNSHIQEEAGQSGK